MERGNVIAAIAYFEVSADVQRVLSRQILRASLKARNFATSRPDDKIIHQEKMHLRW